MSELIDRNVLKAKMYQEAFESDTDMQKWDSGCWIRYKLFKKVVDSTPTVPYGPRWHRVEEPPKEGTWCVIAKHSYLQPHNLFYDIAHYLHGTFSVYDSGVGDWFDGKPLYWMPIEPPKEDA